MTCQNDFNEVFNTSLNNYDYSSLINLLSSDNIMEKQIAVLNLIEIKSANDAKLLASNLVGQDGKIREVVAFKINELINNPNFTDFFLQKDIFDLFMQGIKDINGNVCRHVLEIVRFLKNQKCFMDYFSNEIINQTESVLIEAENADLKNKQYVISKKNFQLYWCMEALFDYIESVDFERLKPILLKTADYYDYTIREKTAKILSKYTFNDFEFEDLIFKIKNDGNYYVRRFFAIQ